MGQGTLGSEARTRLEKSWADSVSGLANAHKTVILEEGMKWHQIGMTSEDAQFLETRKFQVTDIARWFRVPPHMIGDLERATFSNIEQQDLNFIRHTMMPWFVRFEQAITRDLIGQGTAFFPKFNVNALLRGDTKTRAVFYRTMVTIGAMTRNEVREREDMNPLDGLDEPLSPLNMATGNPPPAKSDQAPGPARAIALESATRLVNKEVTAIGKMAARCASDGDAFAVAVGEFYEGHARTVETTMQLSPEVAGAYVERQRGELRFSGVSAMDDWLDTRPGELVDLALGGADLE